MYRRDLDRRSGSSLISDRIRGDVGDAENGLSCVFQRTIDVVVLWFPLNDSG